MTSTDTQGISDEQIAAAVRPLYADDKAASMGLADDIRTARAVLALQPATPPAANQEPSTMQVVAWLNHRACMPPFVDFAASAGTIKSESLVREADALAAIKALQDRIARMDRSLECEKRMRKDAEEDADRYQWVLRNWAIADLPERVRKHGSLDAAIDNEMEKAR